MPSESMYLLRLTDGRVRTLMAYSLKSARVKAILDYKLQPGEEFALKPRGEGEWTFYVRTVNGARTLKR